MCPPSIPAADEEYESDYEEDDFVSESEADDDESSTALASCAEGSARDNAVANATGQTRRAEEPAIAAENASPTSRNKQSSMSTEVGAGRKPDLQVHGLAGLQDTEAAAAELTPAPSPELTARPVQDASVRLSKSSSAGCLGSSQPMRAAAEVLLQQVPSAPCLATLAEQGPRAAPAVQPKRRDKGVAQSRRPQQAQLPRRLPRGWPPEVPAPRAPPPVQALNRGSATPLGPRSRQDPQKYEREVFDCYLPNKRKPRRPSPHNEGDARAPLPQLPKADGKDKRLLMAYNIQSDGKVVKGRSPQDRLFSRILGEIDVEDGRWWR
mmetsp:Transcript_10467/g.18895  ORF Transcript_10467/g.18895 Transcript_10467/m.18895 type:complete len:323 (+) Transcript_10467:94-1062(+)